MFCFVFKFKFKNEIFGLRLYFYRTYQDLVQSCIKYEYNSIHLVGTHKPNFIAIWYYSYPMADSKEYHCIHCPETKINIMLFQQSLNFKMLLNTQKIEMLSDCFEAHLYFSFYLNSRKYPHLWVFEDEDT